MKKHLYFLFMVLVPCQMWAQPTIYNMENNPIGMLAKFLQCSTTGISAGSSGAGVNWSMGSLTHLGTASDTFYESSVANYGTNAPSATRIDSFTSGSNYSGNYYINQSTGNTNRLFISYTTTTYTSYSSPVSGLLVAKQPFNYLDSYTDTFNLTYTSSSLSVPYNGYYTVDADGYGSLTLPNATYNNVLRVHITEIDTIHDAGGPHLASENTYAWYDDTHSVPLCKIVYDTFTSGNSMKAYYMLSQSPLVSVVNVNKEKPDFNACFYGNDLVMNSNFEQNHSYSISVLNMAGQKVYSNSFKPSGSNATFNIGNWLCPGIYMVALIDNNTHSFNTIKVLRQ